MKKFCRKAGDGERKGSGGLDVMVLFLLLSLPCAKRWMHRESFEFAA